MSILKSKDSTEKLFVVVQTFNHSGTPQVVAGKPTSHTQAMRQFRWFTSSGCYQPDSGRRIRVMKEDEYQRTHAQVPGGEH